MIPPATKFNLELHNFCDLISEDTQWFFWAEGNN